MIERHKKVKLFSNELTTNLTRVNKHQQCDQDRASINHHKLSSNKMKRKQLSSSNNKHELNWLLLRKQLISSRSSRILLLITIINCCCSSINSIVSAYDSDSVTTQPDTLNAGKLLLKNLPEIVSENNGEPVLAMPGQDVYLSCQVRNLQNYTIIWRYSNNGQSESTDPADTDVGVILSAGRQRVAADSRYSVIQGHDTWLLKISPVRLSDTGAYICQTNSSPKVKSVRLLSVVRSSSSSSNSSSSSSSTPNLETEWTLTGNGDSEQSGKHLHQVSYDFTKCCRNELVPSTCMRLCTFGQLSSSYSSINVVHRCYSSLPQITNCMIGGRNHTDCCQKRHVPIECNPICGQGNDISTMSVQDQYKCAGYSAAIMSCIAEGIDTLPTQPDMIVIEAVSSTRLRVSWQMASDAELRNIDGWIINLTKLSSFADTIVPSPMKTPTNTTTSSSTLSSPSALRLPGLPASVSQPKALANLTIVDVMNNSSLAAMSRALAAATTGTVSLKLAANTSEFDIDQLNAYTVYQIQMFSYNRNGASQLSDPIRAVTLSPESDTTFNANATTSDNKSSTGDNNEQEPQLPDTRKCCQDRGVKLKRCLDTMCDPVEAHKASIADLMICAPWSNTTFSCMASHQDHSNCCRRRGVSPFCLPMCSGDLKRVDHRHFRCLTHMSTYTNCILESYDVLPAAPRNFTVGPITASWAVLNWQPAPVTHKMSRSIQGYRIYWRKVEPPVAGASATSSGDSNALTGGAANGDADEYVYSTAEAAINPYLLDGLDEESVYETFAVSVNRYGQSDTSARFIFQTLASPETIKLRQEQQQLKQQQQQSPNDQVPAYNVTDCCMKGGLHDRCLGVCRYDMSINDASLLDNLQCSTQLPIIVRCMAGNRNSVPCCRNKQVSDACINTCAGLTERSPMFIASRCAADFGKIIGCMDDSARQIPSAPGDLHTLSIGSNRMTLKWSPAPEDALRTDVEYQIRYQQLGDANQASQSSSSSSSSNSDEGEFPIALHNFNVTLHPLDYNLIVRTKDTQVTLDQLMPNTRYSLYVTAQNSYGVSLPSLVLMVTTNDGNDDEHRTERASLSAPHSLEVVHQDTETIVLKWMAPLFVNADARLTYRVFYRRIASSSSSVDNSTNRDGQSTSSNLNEPIQNNGTNGAKEKWAKLVTTETAIQLRNLRYSSQYAIAVQAFSQQHWGHLSELVLVWTAKPVPPTLNHPLIIGQPIEGSNITVMCVALGQPIPQISMFINGLLVQKRTQPYVIYHLVNLSRGHLTITCVAANGHGADYASVQSRTELTIKFPTSITVSGTRQVQLLSQSMARLTCQVSGNPQPTLVWTYTSSSNTTANSIVDRLVTANDRVSTVLSSNYDTPFTWTHTLILKNISQLDAGKYQCKARNPLGSNSDTIELIVEEPNSPIISPIPVPVSTSSSGQSPTTITETSQQQQQKKYQQQQQQQQQLVTNGSDLVQCCRSQNVTLACQSVCSIDGLDVDAALKKPECYGEFDKLMVCAADGSDHRNCCRSKQVPLACLRWCSGSKLATPTVCFLSSAVEINTCFQEGKPLLPGPPRNVRIVSAQVAMSTLENNVQDSSTNNESNDNNIVTPSNDLIDASNSNSNSPLYITWDVPIRNAKLVQFYRVFWRPFGTKELNRTVTVHRFVRLDSLDPNKMYEFIVKAGNHHGTSLYSDPFTITPEDMERARNSWTPSAWFLTSSLSGSSSVFGRVLVAVGFASLFMLTAIGAVMFLEKRGYLRRFASSKSNGARINFANPTYMKDTDVAIINDTQTTQLDVLNSSSDSSTTST